MQPQVHSKGQLYGYDGANQRQQGILDLGDEARFGHLDPNEEIEAPGCWETYEMRSHYSKRMKSSVV